MAWLDSPFSKGEKKFYSQFSGADCKSLKLGLKGKSDKIRLNNQVY